ncbi:MAG: hypothetical protein U9Q91_00235 [Candidatus Marinimicrobia bacterium]|nr:hypothetical protein [Candidatus Neomarinimicrobiota bacterium]
MYIYHSMKDALEGTELISTRSETYLGPITHRVPNMNVRFAGEHLAWKKQDSDLLPAGLGPIYLPPDFSQLIGLLEDLPLKKSGMKVDPQQNIDFLKTEISNWLNLDSTGPQEKYDDMWSDVPNISEYAQVASSRIVKLKTKLNSLLKYKMDSSSRSFELRFPTEYCPIVWSFCISPPGDSLDASLVFRSVEVSRNLLNDLYLFCVYFGYIFTLYKEEKLFEIKVTAFNIFAQDAHIIDFG